MKNEIKKRPCGVFNEAFHSLFSKKIKEPILIHILMNILKSMWTYQCPRCRSSKMFKTPFQMKKPLDMHDNCEVCGQNFTPEPGFYFGAMFISYILMGWFLLLPALFLKFALDWSVGATMAFVLALAALTYFKFLRFSRSLWIHIIVKYDKRFANQTEVKEV